MDVAQLRSWLAAQHESGAARTTLARRGAAARTFTALAHRRGWLATDPGPRLGTREPACDPLVHLVQLGSDKVRHHALNDPSRIM